MALSISEDMLHDLSVMVRSFKQVCDLFGLTDEQRVSPNAGDWIVDCIKQYQTAYTITKSMKLQMSANQKIENYHSPTAMPPAPEKIT